MEHLCIERWKQLLAHHQKPWVVFAHGTCVALMKPEQDIPRQATALIDQWPVHAGDERGDFSVLTLTDLPGWVITAGHQGILTYLAPEEVEREDAPEVALGLQGRDKRDQDAREQRIIFIKSTE